MSCLAYRIYNPAKSTVVESHNVTFLETPAYSLPLSVTSEDYHYEGDVLRFTSALDGPLMTEDIFDGEDFYPAMEQEAGMQRLRQEVRRLSRMNATYRELPTSPQPLSASPAVASNNSGVASPSIVPGTTGEPEDASPGASPTAPTTPAAGNVPTVSRTGRCLQVTQACTRNSPNDEDTVDSSEVPRALLLAHTMQPDPSALTFSQLMEIAAKASGFVIETETADFAHLDGDSFASSRAFVYATGAPGHKGISEEGNQPLKIPNSYKDAVKSPQWKGWQGAIQKEMDSLKQHDVYKLVNISSVSKREKIIGSRFVFKQKADGRFKARLVVQGHVQEPGIDYGRSYARVCRIGSIRTPLAIACEHGCLVWQTDVVVAFLQSLIDKNVFVESAPGHDPRDSKTGEVMVYKLQRSLYGLAQSPVLWYDTTDGVLVVIGSRPTQSDPCMYTHGSGVTLVILTLYVDDILITRKDPTLVEQKKKKLKERFEMTDMGEVSRILGMGFTGDYDEGTLAIAHTAYVDNILERFGMQDANAAHTPGYGPELSAEQPEDKLLEADATKLYQSFTGSLLYLAQCTRYDLCYAVNQLTRACSKPAEIHMTAAKHALRYLRERLTYRSCRSEGNCGWRRTQTHHSEPTPTTASRRQDISSS